ncbi:MAG: hypothetical protein GWP06_06925 [Actinobacteria bacterium]|nr:hypothetical protein [Actinomycetota bacterium]
MKKFTLLSIIFLSVSILSCNSEKKSESNQTQGMQQKGNLPGGEVLYTVPQGWISEQPSGSMRRAQFRLPGANGQDDGVLAVFFFPGSGGSVQSNLSRWYNQFTQPDEKQTHEIAKVEKKTVHGLPVTITFATGTFHKSASSMTMGGPKVELPNYALLAAIVETNKGPWFFKAIGPEKTLLRWKQSFYEFVDSFHTNKSV